MFQSKDYLYPLRQWLNQMEIRDEFFAHLLCRLIPTQCPFERDLKILRWKICHIPPSLRRKGTATIAFCLVVGEFRAEFR